MKDKIDKIQAYQTQDGKIFACPAQAEQHMIDKNARENFYITNFESDKVLYADIGHPVVYRKLAEWLRVHKAWVLYILQEGDAPNAEKES
jgi:hypothetical protein